MILQLSRAKRTVTRCPCTTLVRSPVAWEATNEIVSVSAPGVPAEALSQMIGQKTTARNCITPEQAAKPNANFLAVQENSNCTYQDWSMADRKSTRLNSSH